MTLLPERTAPYKTYVKETLVEAFREVFQHHIDTSLARTNVTIDYPRTEGEFPTVLVRFFERDIQNMGVGHVEYIHVDGADGKEKEEGEGVFKFRHYLYHGDIEYAIFGLSTLDRDLLADTIVQTLGMGELEEYTNRFFERVYPNEPEAKYPSSIWHFININVDTIQGMGETQMPTPWISEDDKIYQATYRTPVFGEFYSVPPNIPKEYLSKVILYPYTTDEPIPTGNVPADAWEPPFSNE